MPKIGSYLEIKNLLHDPMRLIVAMSGIGFAALLMFVQTGFQNALYESTVALLRNLDADVVIVSRARYSLMNLRRFERKHLWQAGATDGVATAKPLYIERCNWRVVGQQARPIRVVAYELGSGAITLDGVQSRETELRQPRAALIDLRSRSINYNREWFWGVPRDPARLEPVPVELSGTRVKLVGTFLLGSDFAHDGNLVMSARTFADTFPYRAGGDDPLSLVDLGLIRVEKGRDPATVAAQLRELLPSDSVHVYTMDEFIAKEIRFWSQSTPIGTIFGIGVLVGFVVGVIFCYQIMQTDIADKLAEFATLKAMGYRPSFFVAVVIRQAFYLSLLGYFPGLLLSMLANQGISLVTGLVMQITLMQAIYVFAITLAMCVVSGGFVVRKLIRTDPAELF